MENNSETDRDAMPEADPTADIQIELHSDDAEPEAEQRPDPADRDELSVITIGAPAADPRPFVHFGCLKQALAHARSDTETEVGGVLVGESYPSERGLVIELTAALPAATEEAGLGYVTFSHQAWTEIYRQLDAMGTDLRILGWYHSHPGFGIFLSHQDRFIHNNFFAAPESVALVVDPLFERVGLFGWREGELVSLGGVRILADEACFAAAGEMAEKLSYDVADEEEGMASLRERLAQVGQAVRRILKGQ